jgi:ankyrin repeat protein
MLRWIAHVALGLLVASPLQAAESGGCREIEAKYDTTRRQLTSLEINQTLFLATDNGCEGLARRLLNDGASLQAKDRLGAMPLSHAAREGRPNLVGLYLDRGAAIDARNLFGATALYYAADTERPRIVALLLEKGADPDLPGRSGVTPLAAAAFKGNDRIVEQLLAGGADPKIVDQTGKAAITYAAARGFADVVRRLLDAGVAADARYGNELTALMWAAGHDEGVGARATEAVIGLLLDRDAPIDVADNRGRTALMIAAEQNDPAMVELLLKRGADRALRDRQGKTALDLTVNEAVRERLKAK